MLLTMPTVKSEVRSKLVSTYYDKPTLALHRERLSLRVRKQGSEFVQTVKAENPTQADILERKEWEDQIPSKRPVLDAPKTGKRLPDTVRGEELRPVFTTTVTRTVIEISPGPSARIEAAIDEGEIRTSKGDAVEPISEIELELKNGDPRVIFDAALQLLEAAPIRIETRSKAERGYRLLGTDGLMPQAVRVGPSRSILPLASRPRWSALGDTVSPIFLATKRLRWRLSRKASTRFESPFGVFAPRYWL